MPSQCRVRIAWAGWPGAPGVTTLFTNVLGGPNLAAIRTFIDGLKVYIPAGITLQIENSGQIIDTTTGKATSAWSGATQTVVTGTGTGGWAAPAGLLIHWKTGVFVNGREMRGRSFFVPVVSSTFTTDGTVNNTDVVNWRNAATAFITAMGGTLETSHRKTGAIAPVLTASVPDKAVVLTSRRQ